MHFFTLATALALAGSAVASPTWGLEPRQAATLDAAMKARGRSYIGTSLTIRSDTQEQSIIKSEFGSVTPENAMKWDATEPNKGQFTLTGGDQIANWSQTNNKQLRCHTLLWHTQLPSWVSQINNNATLISVIENHINTLMTRWKGKCTHWDVVNEALAETGARRDTVFQKVIGDAFIPIAFRIAAKADPSAKLYYNDYNLEYGTAKHKAAIGIVKLIQQYGVKIDGVGLQGHLVSETTSTQDTPTPSVATLTQVLKDFTDLGVDVVYTEVDIRSKLPTNSQKQQVSAQAWARVAQSCINVARCVGITIWGVKDSYSWVPATFSGEGDALLWNDSWQKKAAYTAFLDVLNGQNTTQTR